MKKKNTKRNEIISIIIVLIVIVVILILSGRVPYCAEKFDPCHTFGLVCTDNKCEPFRDSYQPAAKVGDACNFIPHMSDGCWPTLVCNAETEKCAENNAATLKQNCNYYDGTIINNTCQCPTHYAWDGWSRCEWQYDPINTTLGPCPCGEGLFCNNGYCNTAEQCKASGSENIWQSPLPSSGGNCQPYIA